METSPLPMSIAASSSRDALSAAAVVEATIQLAVFQERTMSDTDGPTDKQQAHARSLHSEAHLLNAQADQLDHQATTARAGADAMEAEAQELHRRARALHQQGDEALDE